MLKSLTNCWWQEKRLIQQEKNLHGTTHIGIEDGSNIGSLRSGIIELEKEKNIVANRELVSGSGGGTAVCI